MIPNLINIVRQVRDSKNWDLSTRDGLCEYSNAVVSTLHKTNPNFGHLLKIPAQNHCTDSLGRLHAVDAVLYLETGQVVDFIINAGPTEDTNGNKVGWSVGPEREYGPDKWFAPSDDGSDNPIPSNFLEARVNILEDNLKKLQTTYNNLQTQYDNMQENFKARLTWLENGQTGPNHRGTGMGSVSLFGFTRNVIVDVITSPIVKQPITIK